MENKVNIVIKHHPVTGDPFWHINSLSALDEIGTIVKRFVKENYFEDYSLSIYDCLTTKTIEIDCKTSEIEPIVCYIYNIEHAFPLEFVGLNSFTKSYVIGMNLSKGHVSFGRYKSECGKLIKM